MPLTETGKSALEERLRSRQDSYINSMDILLSGIHNIEGSEALINARYHDFNFEAEMLSPTATSTSFEGLLSKWHRSGSLSATVIKARQGDEEALNRILRALDHIDLPHTTLHEQLLDLALLRRDALEIDPVNVTDFSVIKAREWVMNNVPRDVLETAGVVTP